MKLLAVVCIFMSQTALAGGSLGSDLLGDFFGRAISDNNNPADLLPGVSLEQNLFRLDRVGHTARLNIPWTPWADRAWRPNTGMIAARYSLSGWKEDEAVYSAKLAEITSNSLQKIALRGNADEIRTLSPAEKYDLISGDLSGTFTHALWEESKRLLDLRPGDKTWLGLCEGSAAAAIGFPEPRRPVEVKSLHGGLPIRFEPLDIKGLAAFLWSTYSVDIPIVGGRCEKANGTDLARMDCWDTNPASWHIAALNLLGLGKGRLVIDEDNSFAIWNVPVISYRFQYINRNTNRVTDSLEEALVPLTAISSEERMRNRSPGTMSIVGVKMDVEFGRRRGARESNTDSMPLTTRNVEFSYDLELDVHGHVLGGEWISRQRPDFMWAILPGFVPSTDADHMIPDARWNGVSIASHWAPAIRASSVKLQPMAAIIKKLVELSALPTGVR